jgi:DNA-binding NarL/FixJ family response regulator
MSDRPLNLLLIDSDPIFRLGLRVALEEIPYLRVVAEVGTDTAALQVLAELAKQDLNQVNLVVLELGHARSRNRQQHGLQLCEQLKILYPHLPILLLSSISDSGLLLAAQAAGVDGYCPKGTPVTELMEVMQKIVAGGSVWWEEVRGEIIAADLEPRTPPSILAFNRVRNNLRLSGIGYIDATLQAVNTQLQIPGLAILDQAVLAGQRRELLAARWLLNHLLATPQERQQEPQQVTPSIPQSPPVSPSLRSAIATLDSEPRPVLPSLLSPRALQSALFADCVTKLQFPLQNVTETPLEIDILREDKRRELLYLVLQKISQQLDELREVQITKPQLYNLKNSILSDLWAATITSFFGKFALLQVGDRQIEMVEFLLQTSQVVQTEILNKIPLVIELFSYLLLQSDLQVDNTSYAVGSPEAKAHALDILENLLIHVANSVMQPLLNNLADLEVMKQNLYDRKLISTREIERFRNDLSWRYRLQYYVNEPKAIFESRYELFVIAPRGIAKTSIYAPRNQELAQLNRIPLIVTLIIEFRDAIAPRLQSLLSVVGSGIVFILTQVIGRGLGLIGRGILQGIGSVSFSDKNLRRNGEKTK